VLKWFSWFLESSSHLRKPDALAPLLTAVAGGNPPPLYNADRFTVPQFVYQGFFVDITDFAQSAGVTQDLYDDFAWNETIYKDTMYALPFDTNTRALWYNKDIVKSANLDPEKPPQTLPPLGMQRGWPRPRWSHRRYRHKKEPAHLYGPVPFCI